MKLNLGCGARKLDGWLNVDKDPCFAPDRTVDLEHLPWPWADSSVDEVLLSHVLEHLGQAPQTFLGVIRELWRVCRPNALVTIVVPHPRSDAYLNDPTHVRPITPAGLELFSQARNREWQAEGKPNSALGLELGVDFGIERVTMVPEESWIARLRRGEITEKELAQAARQYNNVIVETTILWRAVKPG
jgi:hypothetical protein